MEDRKNKILRGQIPTSVFYILFGLCLALMPVETVNVLCKVVFGMVLIGAGIYHVLIFVLEKDNSTILDLFSGVIVLVIGLFLFMNPTVVVKLLTLMLGAFVLVDSIWMMRGSMKLKKRKQGAWKAFLVESLVFIGLGILILVNPFSEIKMTVQVSGWIFVANGVLDIIFYMILRHGLKKEIAADENEKKPLEKEKQEYDENDRTMESESSAVNQEEYGREEDGAAVKDVRTKESSKPWKIWGKKDTPKMQGETDIQGNPLGKEEREGQEASELQDASGKEEMTASETSGVQDAWEKEDMAAQKTSEVQTASEQEDTQEEEVLEEWKD